jgi:hypothetical protein
VFGCAHVLGCTGPLTAILSAAQNGQWCTRGCGRLEAEGDAKLGETAVNRAPALAGERVASNEFGDGGGREP